MGEHQAGGRRRGEELMRDGEEGHFRGGAYLSFSLFVLSSISAANIHRSHGRTSSRRATTGIN